MKNKLTFLNKTFLLFSFVAILIGSFDFILLNKNFPITEGWWETYVYFMDQGFKPYVDFSIKFPPLYIYLINFLTKFIGFDFYKLKLFSIFLNLIGVAGLYYWLTRLSSAIPAAFGTIFAVGLVMANPVYLTKDYHTLVMAIIPLILITLTNENFLKNRRPTLYINLLFSGLFCGLLLLTKQNIGVFFGLGVFLYWFFASLFYLKGNVFVKQFFSTLFYLIGFAIPVILVIFYSGFDWLAIFYSNDSKGSPLHVLTRFISSREHLSVELAASLLITSVLLILRKKSNFFDLFLSDINKNLFISNQIWLIIPIAIFFICFKFYLYVLALAWPIIRLLPFKNKFWEKPDFLLCLPLYMLAYCATHTAGYNEVGLEILVALMFTDIAKYFYFKSSLKYQINKIYLLSLIALVFIFSIAVKIYGSSYNWWGLKTDGLRGTQLSLPFNELKGLSADKKTFEIYNSIYKIKNNLTERDEIFSYPSIPIFYLLLKRNFVGTPVLWFDVAGNNDGKHTVDDLNKKQPKYIFWLRPPRDVYEGHFLLRKKDPEMMLVDNWIFDSLEYKRYKVIKAIDTFSGDTYYTSKHELAKLSTRLAPSSHELHFLCKKIYSCHYQINIGGTDIFEMNSGIDSTSFIENANLVFDYNKFVFYILERNNN